MLDKKAGAFRTVAKHVRRMKRAGAPKAKIIDFMRNMLGLRELSRNPVPNAASHVTVKVPRKDSQQLANASQQVLKATDRARREFSGLFGIHNKFLDEKFGDDYIYGKAGIPKNLVNKILQKYPGAIYSLQKPKNLQVITPEVLRAARNSRKFWEYGKARAGLHGGRGTLFKGGLIPDQFKSQYKSGQPLWATGIKRAANYYQFEKLTGLGLADKTFRHRQQLPLIAVLKKHKLRDKGLPVLGTPHVGPPDRATRIQYTHDRVYDSKNLYNDPTFSDPDYQFVFDNSSGKLKRVLKSYLTDVSRGSLNQPPTYRKVIQGDLPPQYYKLLSK